ncbi:MAG: OB-fold nucleic acid binding domain-containing protein, partial [Oscillospiraceae bacterium]|nr:OB-fold nucleic acid binding domain-containing protein [Oscillospiraceae bacterium]
MTKSMISSNKYRSHSTATLSKEEKGRSVRVAGWVENVRDHGGIMFIDLRDFHGVVQVSVQDNALLENVRKEAAVSITGEVVERDPETYNSKIATGEIEIV